MTAILTNKSRFFNMENFLSAVKNADRMVYAFIAKGDEWNAEDTAIVPVKNIGRERVNSEDILAMKRVLYKDLVTVAKYWQWDDSSSTVYNMYDDSVDLHTYGIGDVKPFTVVTGDDYRVYKCISNGGGVVSTQQPTHTGLDIPTESDNYQWKYMYSMKSLAGGDSDWDWVTDPSPSTINVNGLPSWMPVLNVDTRPENSTQWDVRKGSIDGAIHRIEVNATLETNATVKLYKDATTEWTTVDTGFLATSSSDGLSIIINNPGKGINNIYKIEVGSTEYILPHNTIRPIYSPPGGHGSDPIKELLGSYLYINALIDQDISIPTGYYRKVGLIYDPLRKTKTDGTDNQLTHINDLNELVLGEKLGKSMAEDTDYLDYSGHITYIDNLETAGTKSVGQTVSLMLILSF